MHTYIGSLLHLLCEISSSKCILEAGCFITYIHAYIHTYHRVVFCTFSVRFHLRNAS